jgi:hypothetical protein
VNCLCVLGVSGQGGELCMCVRGIKQGSELSMCVRGIRPGK